MATAEDKRLRAKRIKRTMFRANAASAFGVVKVTPSTSVLNVELSHGVRTVSTEAFTRALNEQLGIAALGSAMATTDAPVSPELARSLQAEENWWRRIEAEHGWLSSTDTARLLGRSANRTYASAQRRAGKLLGYQRGRTHRYPKFQFDLSKGTVLPVIPELIAVSRSYGVPDEDLVLWLCSPTSQFVEQNRPVDHLDESEAVLAAAHDEFGAQW